jgi:hypothetical protein
VSGLERRYRRLLRLLPAGYRQTWEEDMVSAFLESQNGSTSGRPSIGEQLSVVTLAVRLWLTGSHATPRGLVWYRTVHIFALLALLYQAVAGSVGIARTAAARPLSVIVHSQDVLGNVVTWGRSIVQLLWIVALVLLAFGRLRAARRLVLAVATAALGVSLVLSHGYSAYGRDLVAATLDNVAQRGFLAATVLAVLLIPAGPRRPPTEDEGRARLLWLAVYGVGALVLVPVEVHRAMPPGQPSLLKLYLELSVAMHVGLFALMVIALGWAARGGSNPHWLLALALFGGFDAVVHLLYGRETVGLAPIVGFSTPSPLVWIGVEALLAALALVCAAVGALVLSRLPRAVPGPA